MVPMQIHRNILIVIILLFAVVGCNNNPDTSSTLSPDIVNNPKSANGESHTKGIPGISFNKMEHDFGRVIEGEKITYAFKFSNTGTGNLILTNVSSSCGCTVPEYTSDPIKPGETGNIKVTFDSENRKGFQNKTVTVVSNTQPNTTVLRIRAQVIEPEKF